MSHPRQLVAFAAVGTAGFLVDAGILTLLSSGFGADVYLSRAFSFTSAVLVTWLLNRSLVFKIRPRLPREKGRELGSYFIVQTGGALLNLATFAALIWLVPGLRAVPVLPLAAGAVLGLVFNFSGSRAWVFD